MDRNGFLRCIAEKKKPGEPGFFNVLQDQA
jgi:hypothetical protein